MNTKLTTVLAGLFLMIAAGAYAHHATGPVYDRSRTVEMEGEVTEVLWRNPHIGFTVAGVDSNGDPRMLEIETNSVSIVSRFGLTPGLVSPGTRVTVAGNPGRMSADLLWLTNMLLPSGDEILFGSRYAPRWSDRTIGEDIRGEITPDVDGRGIFRVWTNGGGGSLWNSSYPLTPAAQAARDRYDPVADDPTQNCAPKGMPYIMEQPYPMQFIDEGEAIVMRLEEYDTVRRFYMSAEDVDDSAPPNLIGRSVGRWEGDTLVVDTTAIDYGFFNNAGIRQSPAVQTEERFTLNEDGSVLNYQLTVTDPATFAEPVVQDKTWVWRPGEEVRPYDCASSE
ncbi:DUF6152 family protein [Candidatus Rariloculus sp.]|uniref:DUF6152 family protein n=1 Tax=Candidatus Rariloculus sp. TaxID=3101265 RepID=UPI003D0A7035